jgi:hypothetical protein
MLLDTAYIMLRLQSLRLYCILGHTIAIALSIIDLLYLFWHNLGAIGASLMFQKFPEGGYWKGKNFTFDKRTAIGAYGKQEQQLNQVH